MLPKELKKIDEVTWELPVTYKPGMNVPARIIASKKLIEAMDNGVFEQITNVACLAGIKDYSYCMPDGHWGYGFPIGGVAAFDAKEGVISPGGVGFDINCGMRLLTTNLTFKEVKPKLKELVDSLFKRVPAGVGSRGFVNLNNSQFEEIAIQGSKWCIDNGYGWEQDVQHTESYGCIPWADINKVSNKAKERGMQQLGTLGSGNHYLEIQVAHKKNVFDEVLADQFGINVPDQIVVMFHCGSRGFGHQIGTDYLRIFDSAMKKYNITVRDRELACAPFSSKEGQDYYKAMACAANMAFANRQVIVHRIREVFSKVFNDSPENLEMNQVYDVAHNIAKVEKYNGKELVVHRKGATRAFGPGNEELPPIFRKTGQPVIIGGSMETGSYLLVGTKKAEDTTFSSTAHGSGRTMSRMKAKKQVRGEKLLQEMERKGIYVRSTSMSGLAEEAGFAYKQIDDVIDSINKAGISKPVVRLVPLGNVKGAVGLEWFLTSFVGLLLFVLFLLVNL